MKSLALSLLAILGIAAPASAQTWSERTIGGMRTLVYVPASAGTRGIGRGLLVVLHGCTQQIEPFRDRGGLTEPADFYGAVVAVPAVPNGGVVAGCWDYYGANHTRTSRHDDNVLDAVEALLGDATLGIDPAQVYVAGLSSGAGEAAVLGCVAPDVFAGVGINAGPAVGTSISQISTPAVSAAVAADTCRTLAGVHVGEFATQLASVIYGSMDFVVAQGYGPVNADAFADLYGSPPLTATTLDVAGLRGYQPAGSGSQYADAEGTRITRIAVMGMGHAWPAGTGAGQEINFIASKGPAWPWHLLELFTSQNRRVAGGPVPPIDAGFLDGGGYADAAPGIDARPGIDASPTSDAGARDASNGLDGTDATTVEAEPDGGCGCNDEGRGTAGGRWLIGMALLVLGRLRWREKSRTERFGGHTTHPGLDSGSQPPDSRRQDRGTPD